MPVNGDTELSRFKRFQAEQYKAYGLRLVELEKLIRNYTPGPQIAPRTKDLLARQIEMFANRLRFLEMEVLKIKKHLGIKDG